MLSSRDGFSVTSQQLISFKNWIKAVKGFCQMDFCLQLGFWQLCVEGNTFFTRVGIFFPERNEDKMPADISGEGPLFISGTAQAGTAARWITFSHFPDSLLNHPCMMVWPVSTQMWWALPYNLLSQGQRKSLWLELMSWMTMVFFLIKIPPPHPSNPFPFSSHQLDCLHIYGSFSILFCLLTGFAFLRFQV